MLKLCYGADRLTKPLLRVDANGNFDKKGQFAPVSWERAFDIMEEKAKAAFNEKGPEGVAVICIWSIYCYGRLCSTEDDERWISFKRNRS